LNAVAERVGLEERTRSEGALETSQSQLAEAQAIARLGSWEWSVADRRLAWSDEMYRVFELPLGTRVGYRTFITHVHADDVETCRAALDTAYETGQPFSLEHRIVRPSGEVRWVLSRGRVIHDADGKPARLLGTVQDITERKEIEQRLMASDRLVS